MARIKTISVVESISGKIDSSENLVFSTRYGQVHAWEQRAYRGPYTQNQQQIKSIFSQAQAKATQDMADPEKRAEWEAIAKASDGRWKTARGAAFASYFAEIKEQQQSV